jgi:hypothetical protein
MPFTYTTFGLRCYLWRVANWGCGYADQIIWGFRESQSYAGAGPYLAQIASQAKNEREHGQYARKAVFQPSGRQRRSHDLSTRLPQKSVIELRDLEKAHQMA